MYNVTLYYYLVEMVIYSKFAYVDNSILTRLVLAKDKNEAYDKANRYLKEVYCSDPEGKFDIHVNETIL